MTRVLLVGGSAQLGRYVIEALRRELGSVKITVMDLRPYTGPWADEIESVHGDLTRGEDCARVLSAARFDVVISMVTPDLHRASAEAFQRVNVDGMKVLLAASRAQGVRAFVYISSIAVTDHFRDHVNADEGLPLPGLDEYRSPYDRSKRLGEDAVLGADTPGAMRCCALRLGGVLADMHDLTLRYLLGPMVVLQDHGRPIDMIYAGNAGHGIALATRALLDRPDGVGGHAFFLTKGRAMTTHELFTIAGGMLGRRVFVMPPAMRAMVLHGLEAKHALAVRLRRPVPGIPLHTFMRIQSFTQTFDNTKIATVLGYTPRCTLEDGLAQIIESYQS